MTATLHPARERHPVVGDVLLRPLGPTEAAPPGWTVAGTGTTRQGWRRYTGTEPLDLSRDCVLTPPATTDLRTGHTD